MLTPQLQQLLEALTTLKELPHTPGVVCQDEFGGDWAIAKAFAIGSRTDDPGLVIRLQAQPAGLCRPAPALDRAAMLEIRRAVLEQNG